MLATFVSWRLTWAGIALRAAVAAFVNLRTVPRLQARHSDADAPRRSPLRRAMVRPLAYAVLYFAACTIHFTYASDAARSGGLAASAAAVVFALIGVAGQSALLFGAGYMVGSAALAIWNAQVVAAEASGVSVTVVERRDRRAYLPVRRRACLSPRLGIHRRVRQAVEPRRAIGPAPAA